MNVAFLLRFRIVKRAMSPPAENHSRPVRLRCGVVFTGNFVRHLHEFYREGKEENPGKVPAIAYVKFADGKRKGEEWWSLRWESAAAFSESEVFDDADVPIGLSRQSQRGLGSKYVDFAGGRIIVA